MNTVESVATVKLTKTEYGTIRIGDTRVSLDTVVYHFNLGSTAEEIFHRFPALNLADIYGAISYYLANREYVDAYMQEQEVEAEKIAAWAEERFGKQNAELRERILARNAARLSNLTENA